jgi:hypothetical protein
MVEADAQPLAKALYKVAAQTEVDGEAIPPLSLPPPPAYSPTRPPSPPPSHSPFFPRVFFPANLFCHHVHR